LIVTQGNKRGGSSTVQEAGGIGFRGQNISDNETFEGVEVAPQTKKGNPDSWANDC